jgi:hypothetical protein
LISKLKTLKQIRDGIKKEPGLCARNLWDGKHPCAIGVLVPPTERIPFQFIGAEEAEDFLSQYKTSFLMEVYLANDKFKGTVEARRDYMLNWVETKIKRLETV